MTPPRLSRWLLRQLAPRDMRDAFVDDLDEAFTQKVTSEGLHRARGWYRRQARTGAWSLMVLRNRARGSADHSSVHTTSDRPAIFDQLSQDARYAMRALRRTPGFAIAALLLLALGIGANTAVFSVVHAVLLRPLPYPNADRLVLVTPPAGGVGAVNLPQFGFFRDHMTTWSSAGGSSGWSDVSVTGADGNSEWIKSIQVTSGFFQTLGIAPVYGREFSAAEMQLNGPGGVILTDALWRRRFGADPSVVGRSAVFATTLYPAVGLAPRGAVLPTGATSYQIIGVLPRDFWWPIAADAFFPLRPTGRSADTGLNTEMIARIAPGHTAAQVNAELTALSAQFARELPDGQQDSFHGLTTVSYQRAIVGDMRTNLMLLFGAVFVLLLIACSNLASLLLARFIARQREIAVRLVLGASTGRLLRQFAIENALLCLTGSAAGVLVASGALKAFVGVVPFSVPLAAPIRIDGAALTFAIAAGLATGVVFSLLPLVTSGRHAAYESLKATARSHGGTRRSQRVRGLLVVSEVALSVCLLVGAALLIQSLYRLHQEPLGFSPEGRLTFFTPVPPSAQNDRTARVLFDAEMMARLRAIPGVTGVAGANVLPLTSQNNFPTERVGHPDQAIGGMEIRFVTSSYFEVIGTSIVRGRAFTSEDTAATPPVVLVNETLARRWWPDASPLGDELVIGRYKGQTIGNGPAQPPRTVVGVVADTKSVYLTAAPRPTIYVSAAQPPWITGGTTWVVRGDLDSGLAERVRQTILAADPAQRIGRMQTLSAIVAATTKDSRFDAWLCGIFAGLALVLTTVGLYGLLAFSIARRTSEIGIRVALGASRVHVMGLVVRQGVGLTLAGLAVGLGASFWLSRFLTSLLFGVRPTDLTSFAVVSVVLFSVGVLASVLPARRAARVDPLVALRVE